MLSKECSQKIIKNDAWLYISIKSIKTWWKGYFLFCQSKTQKKKNLSYDN